MRPRRLLATVALAALPVAGLTAPASAARTVAPPPVVLHVHGHRIPLAPWAYCWSQTSPDGQSGSGVCMDSASPDIDKGHRAVRTAHRIRFSFARRRFTFTASYRRIGTDDDWRRLHVAKVAPRRFRLAHPARHGRFLVELSGAGHEGTIDDYFVWRYRR